VITPAIHWHWRCLALLLLAGISGVEVARAQSIEPAAGAQRTRLEVLFASMSGKKALLGELRARAASTTPPTPDMLEAIDVLQDEFQSLKRTFDQLAAGGIELVEITPEGESFDWRKELILVTQPLLENLTGLTEKPRKIERLKSIIEQRQTENQDIGNALNRIEQSLIVHQGSPVLAALTSLQLSWQQKRDDNEQALELARFQLSTLMGDNTPRLETIKKVVFDFLRGRGLTLGLVVFVSLLLWLLTRGLLWVMLRKKTNTRQRSRQVGHRLASYGYSFFTTLLILIGVMVVLYVRGDLLLLALAIIVLASVALSLRTILPRFVSEARLLLNIGAIREGERVTYFGLPLEVQSINVHSYLRNPDLEGSIRLPLRNLKDMTSRPANNERWFPTLPGDVLRMDDGGLSRVVRQTTDFVELRSRTGSIHYYPTTDFLSLNFENLSRAGEFIVVSYFGVDYGLQAQCLDIVPAALQQNIASAFAESRFAEQIESVSVDFHAAAASSLDYIIFIKASADIAISRYAIERIAQQACVDLCNRNHWSIPFQQIVVHQRKTA